MILPQVFVSLCAAASARAACDACLGHACHTRTLLYTGFPIQGQLAIDRSTDTLYYHFEDSDGYDFNAYYNVNDFNFQLIPGLGFTFARAVDPRTRRVYMSRALNGIYTFDPATKLVENIDIINTTVYHMQYKDKLYYCKHKQPGLYMYESGASTPIPALAGYEIDQFVVDKSNDIYFRHDNKIYRLANRSEQPSVYKDSEIYSLTTDNSDGVYLVNLVSLGFYKVDYSKPYRPLKEVGAFGSGLPYGVVFGSDNSVVYHDMDTEEIYHLTPDGGGGACTVTHTAGGTHHNVKLTVSNQ